MTKKGERFETLMIRVQLEKNEPNGHIKVLGIVDAYHNKKMKDLTLETSGHEPRNVQQRNSPVLCGQCQRFDVMNPVRPESVIAKRLSIVHTLEPTPRSLARILFPDILS